jgi:hypothetical protein
MSTFAAAAFSELVAEFCSITGADNETAVSLLDDKRNNLRLALDSFFWQPEDAGEANMTQPQCVCSSTPAAGGTCWDRW